jgi:anti-sigma factor RsiW
VKNPARSVFEPLLSSYVDGELSSEDRQRVEQHLANNKESAAQVADFRAGDALMRTALDIAADDVDFKAMTADIMSRLTPQKAPFFERLRLTLSEMLTYQRGPLLAGAMGAAVAVAVLVPVALTRSNAAPLGYANARVEVQRVSVDEDSMVKPVVLETDDGDAVIFTVSDDDKKDGGKKKKKKKDGEEGEEEVIQEPPKPAGEL